MNLCIKVKISIHKTVQTSARIQNTNSSKKLNPGHAQLLSGSCIVIFCVLITREQIHFLSLNYIQFARMKKNCNLSPSSSFITIPLSRSLFHNWPLIATFLFLSFFLFFLSFFLSFLHLFSLSLLFLFAPSLSLSLLNS